MINQSITGEMVVKIQKKERSINRFRSIEKSYGELSNIKNKTRNTLVMTMKKE